MKLILYQNETPIFEKKENGILETEIDSAPPPDIKVMTDLQKLFSTSSRIETWIDIGEGKNYVSILKLCGYVIIRINGKLITGFKV
jgi:hypothetical protein